MIAEDSLPELKLFLLKAEAWCARQERCIVETERKLSNWECPEAFKTIIINKLINDHFIDEDRFCDSFVRGKFNNKHWGRNKIRFELRSRKINSEIIESALTQIDDNKYIDTIDSLLKKKLKDIKEKDSYKANSKLINFLMSKGYEYDLIKDRIPFITKKQ